MESFVAIDGSKFSAVNHTGRVYTRARLRKLFAEIDGQIGSYFEMLESADEAEKHANEAQHGGVTEEDSTPGRTEGLASKDRAGTGRDR